MDNKPQARSPHVRLACGSHASRGTADGRPRRSVVFPVVAILVVATAIAGGINAVQSQHAEHERMEAQTAGAQA